MSTPWVRIAIVTFNSAPWVQRCLDAVAAQSFEDFEVVVLDNASRDGTADAMVLPDDRFSLLRKSRNYGFAGGANRALAGAETPYLLTLNPDAIAQPGWLEALHAAAMRHPDVAAFGSTQLILEGEGEAPTRVDGFGDVYTVYGIPWRSGYRQPIDALPDRDAWILSPCAAAALYRRDVFEALGGFEERYFTYLEDVDLGLRMALRDHRCLQVRDAVIHHAGAASTAEEGGEEGSFALYHSFRNRVWLLARCAPPGALLVMAPLHLAASLYILGRNIGREKFRPRYAGFRDGLKGLGRALSERKSVQANRRISSRTFLERLVWSRAKFRDQVIEVSSLVD